MTFTGTRSYILGEGEVAVIDPGPAEVGHLAALEAALAPGETVRAVLVSHSHRDHSAGAAAFAARVNAPVLAQGDAVGARSAAMARLAEAGLVGGGEGIDAGFRPDRRLAEGDEIAGPGWSLTALHTPGHLGDHLCFAWAEGNALFTGDLVMGWATTMISPPDGDLAAFRASIVRLQGRSEVVCYPGHGKPVFDPPALLAWLLAHRVQREAEILGVLARGPATVAELTASIYAAVDPVVWPAAGRNVLAHLVDLSERGAVRPVGVFSAAARFSLA
jgi:hydroxyacylglutathione hydrolase